MAEAGLRSGCDPTPQTTPEVRYVLKVHQIPHQTHIPEDKTISGFHPTRKHIKFMPMGLQWAGKGRPPKLEDSVVVKPLVSLTRDGLLACGELTGVDERLGFWIGSVCTT